MAMFCPVQKKGHSAKKSQNQVIWLIYMHIFNINRTSYVRMLFSHLSPRALGHFPPLKTCCGDLRPSGSIKTLSGTVWNSGFKEKLVLFLRVAGFPELMVPHYNMLFK